MLNQIREVLREIYHRPTSFRRTTGQAIPATMINYFAAGDTSVRKPPDTGVQRAEVSEESATITAYA